MRGFTCSCGNTIFFENTQCMTCGCELGWCPVCRNMTGLQLNDGGTFQCGNAACGASLVKCHNYAVEHVCNRCIAAAKDGNSAGGLCDYCRFNRTIPDLSMPGNREKWARLEVAKRRLLYTLDLLRLPYHDSQETRGLPLSFHFKEDLSASEARIWDIGNEERVFTGHEDGRITINLREADTVEREKTRVQFGESQRTLIGHFRHEIAHYYWQMLIQNRCEPDFVAVFGDHQNPAYRDARQRYYEQGAPAGWMSAFVSAYATMHPWEDFAETFATYLDMVSVLDTARHMQMGDGVDPLQAELSEMVPQYARLGVVLNEMNRAMGLPDLVPEVFAPPIVNKLQFVHNLVRRTAATPAA